MCLAARTPFLSVSVFQTVHEAQITVSTYNGLRRDRVDALFTTVMKRLYEIYSNLSLNNSKIIYVNPLNHSPFICGKTWISDIRYTIACGDA